MGLLSCQLGFHIHQRCFGNWLERRICFLPNSGPIWNSWVCSFSFNWTSWYSNLFHLCKTGLPRYLSLTFREQKLLSSLHLKKSSSKVILDIVELYNTNFWWFKCKWSRNIWIPFPINHIQSLKNQGRMCSARRIPFGWTQNIWRNTWRLMKPKYLPIPIYNIVGGKKPLIHGDS